MTCRMFLAFLGRFGGLADQAFPMNLAWLGFSLYFRAARGVLAAVRSDYGTECSNIARAEI